jgi:parB-like partition proteins
MGKIIKEFNPFENNELIKNNRLSDLHKDLFFDGIIDNKREHISTIKEIKNNELFPSDKNPYLVKNDDEMKELAESIRENGILTPLLVRQVAEKKYEIISGHRRFFAAKEILGITLIPCEVIDVSDEDAYSIMVDCNKYRENILPSEQARAYRLKYDSLKRKSGERTDLTLVQIGPRLEENTQTVDIIAENSLFSKTKIKRYIKISNLISPLLDKLDNKKITMESAYNLAFLDNERQSIINIILSSDNKLISKNITKADRENLEKIPATNEDITNYFKTLQMIKEESKQIKIPLNISKLNPIIVKELQNLNEDEIKELIESLLLDYTEQQIEKREDAYEDEKFFAEQEERM